MISLAGAATEEFADVAFVLTDIDDTLTRDGRLEESAYRAMWVLDRAGIKVIPVTGRPAGWCDCIARQWPVAGVVGENGAFAFYQVGGALQYLYHPEAPPIESTSSALEELGRVVLAAIPGTRIAKDQFSRKFDVAIDYREEEPRLGLDVAEQIRRLCEERGAHAKVSSIHVNAWFGNYDKLSMAGIFLSDVFGVDIDMSPECVVFCGDSPNDEPMFARVPLSAAVSNIEPFLPSLRHTPRYLCTNAHGDGFAELADAIIRAHGLR